MGHGLHLTVRGGTAASGTENGTENGTAEGWERLEELRAGLLGGQGG